MKRLILILINSFIVVIYIYVVYTILKDYYYHGEGNFPFLIFIPIGIFFLIRDLIKLIKNK